MNAITPDYRHLFVYFIHERNGGPGAIKIGSTKRCPYQRLTETRNRFKKRHDCQHNSYELLASIRVEDRSGEWDLHRRFSILHIPGHNDEQEWFEPGAELWQFILEHGTVHCCSSLCPSGSAVQEDADRLDRTAGAAYTIALQKALLKEPWRA